MEVRDEVCGMRFDSASAAVSVRLGDRRYYFCSTRCRDRFVEHPHWYVPVARLPTDAEAES